MKGFLKQAAALTQSVCFEPVPRSSAVLMWFWLWFEVWVFVAIGNNGLNRDIALAKGERQQDFVTYSVTQPSFLTFWSANHVDNSQPAKIVFVGGCCQDIVVSLPLGVLLVKDAALLLQKEDTTLRDLRKTWLHLSLMNEQS